MGILRRCAWPIVLVIASLGCGGSDGGELGTGGTAGSGGTRQPDPKAPQVEAYVDAFMREQSTPDGPGLAFALIGPDGPIVEKSYGMADVESERLITLDTPFDIMSISKSITATAVMLLYEDGDVGLDDLIKDVFPEGPAGWDDITVHHLLTHTSGLMSANLRPAAGWENEELLEWLVDQPMSAAPGEVFEYTDTNYVMLALLVERIVQQPFETFVSERIFEPLGMKSEIGYDDFRTDRPQPVKQYLAGRPYEDTFRITGATGANASIEDLKTWAASLEDASVLSPETVELMWTRHVVRPTYSYGAPNQCSYGYGWVMCDLDDFPATQEHSGIGGAMRTGFVRVPSEGLTVIMLSNGAFDDAFEGVARGVVTAYLAE